jgi:hypothetical protein
MKVKKFDGKIENAYGYKLTQLKVKLADESLQQAPAFLPYDGTCREFENIDEVNEANEYPKASELVDMINAKELAKAVAAARTKAMKDHGLQQPTLANDTKMRQRKLYDILIANGETPEDAKAQAAATVKDTETKQPVPWID